MGDCITYCVPDLVLHLSPGLSHELAPALAPAKAPYLAEWFPVLNSAAGGHVRLPFAVAAASDLGLTGLAAHGGLGLGLPSERRLPSAVAVNVKLMDCPDGA